MAIAVPAPLEELAGLLLVGFLPGFGVMRAVFPERRAFRPVHTGVLVEQLTGSIVLSLVATILVGSLWLGTGVGLQAGWSDPLLELSLAAVAAVALSIAAVRGAFARSPPPSPVPEGPDEAEDDPMAVVRRLERLTREERRLRHRLRVEPKGREDPTDRAELQKVLDERAALVRDREAEYAR